MKQKIIFLMFIILSGCSSLEKEQENVEAKKVVKLTSKQIDSLSAIIKASSLKNDIKKIDEVYNTFLKPNWEDTNNVDFYLQRAYTSLMKFKFQDAFMDVNRAKKIDNKDGYVYYINGLIWGTSSPNTDSCIFYYNKAIQLEPNNILYLQTRSETYNSIHKYQNAIDDINIALKNDSVNVELLALKATYLHNNKDFESSLLTFNKVLLKIKRDDIFFFRGSCLYHLGKNELSIKDFDEAIKLNSNIGYYYAYRGAAKFKLKDRDAAFIDFKKAAELGDPEGTKLYNDCLEWYSKHKKA